MPVWEFNKRFGDKISSFGGFDMNKICLMEPDDVRKHVRFLIDSCAANGGYAFGTGNSVANYVPVENFLTAVEEALLYGKY
jgi:uroporphyrinogen decarboxylase